MSRLLTLKGMVINMLTKARILFAHTYFLLLALTAVVVGINLFFDWSVAFYLPFIIGGLGSLILYTFMITIKKSSAQDMKQHKIQAKIICHAFCASVYIIGAFLLLVFYNTNFFAAWSFHVWIIPVLIVSAGFTRDFGLIVLLLCGVFAALFVLSFEGLLGRAITAIGMGSFWGFSFYFLLVFLNDIIENKRQRLQSEG